MNKLTIILNRKTFNIFFITLLFPFLFILSISCNDKSTVPVAGVLKDPREMTWTVDTIYYPGAFQILMDYFGAFSSNDIYVVGFGSGGSSIGSLYHYDGNKWEEQRFGELAIGTLNHITKIENELWGCGYANDYSFIGKSDGKTWQRINIDNSNNFITKGYLQSITGETKTNIWAGGADGLIIHYNGNKWVKDSVKIPHASRFSYVLRSVVMYQHRPFIMGKMFGGYLGDIKVYHITGSEKNWVVQDSMIIVPGQNNVWKFGEEQLHVGKSGKLYSVGNGMWEYQNGAWAKRYSSEDYLQNMFELREDYIFVVGHYGHLAFFNGTSWSRLTELEMKAPGVLYEDVWTDGREVFIVGHLENGYPQKSIVWHGK